MDGKNITLSSGPTTDGLPAEVTLPWPHEPRPTLQVRPAVTVILCANHYEVFYLLYYIFYYIIYISILWWQSTTPRQFIWIQIFLLETGSRLLRKQVGRSL